MSSKVVDLGCEGLSTGNASPLSAQQHPPALVASTSAGSATDTSAGSAAGTGASSVSGAGVGAGTVGAARTTACCRGAAALALQLLACLPAFGASQGGAGSCKKKGNEVQKQFRLTRKKQRGHAQTRVAAGTTDALMAATQRF